ncbi:response regulator transcription factor [Candidatus Nanopelagicus abundans]|uniref:response regulator transcription factor n=1 Tax=Candidatus Nanopelagicus abundans TaxID=1884916 RepID=UPI001CC18562|nr:response regulator transcription factor [Candidatus Nanopelagicus abundans]
MDIVVVDDHHLIRSGLIAALAETDFNVVAEASTVGEGLAVINKFQPDIALVDINLGISSGLDLIKIAISQKSKCKFVVLTMHDQSEILESAKSAGASAFVTKGAAINDLIEIINCISAGSNKFMKAGELKQSKQVIDFDLTNRELDVLSLLPTGATASAIAGMLFLTEPTVKTHLSAIYRKLSAETVRKQ